MLIQRARSLEVEETDGEERTIYGKQEHDGQIITTSLQLHKEGPQKTEAMQP